MSIVFRKDDLISSFRKLKNNVVIMQSKKSVFLIVTGALITTIAILNIFIDFPDLLSTYQLEHNFSNKISNSNSSGSNNNAGNLLSPLELSTPDTVIVPPADSHRMVTPEQAKAQPVPTQIIDGYIPDRIIIPAIHLDAPILSSTYSSLELRDQWFEQWKVPDEFAAGWQTNSAPLGMVGNTVIGGHHNEYGKVFGHLIDLEIGDIIYVFSGKVTFQYKIVEKQVLQERDVSLDIRRENAKWISPTGDERLTLVTCWPKRSNTHRLIIVAEPVVESQTG
jgi:LPXTG-site transpeptidase (sortase) family protein